MKGKRKFRVQPILFVGLSMLFLLSLLWAGCVGLARQEAPSGHESTAKQSENLCLSVPYRSQQGSMAVVLTKKKRT